MSFLKPKYFIIALVILLVDLLISFYYFFYVPMNRGDIVLPPIFSSPTPMALSGNDIKTKFFDEKTQTTKEIKLYEIVIENNQISTDLIKTDTQHDVYFINKDSNVKYLLQLFKDDKLSISSTLGPNNVYTASLTEIGSYSYKILDNNETKFEGKIHVQ